MQTMEEGSYMKKVLRSWSALWTILPIYRLQFFATSASYLYMCSAEALHPPETVVDNMLLPGTGMYGNGHSPESYLVAPLLSVHHASRPSSGVDADFRRRDTNSVEMPAFVGAKESAKTAELAGPEDEEERGEEEDGEEETPEEDTTEKQGTQPSSTTGKSNSELEGDQVIGGVIEEDENTSETESRVGKFESSEGASDTKESFHIQREAPAETKRTVEEKTIHERNVQETNEGLTAPSRAAQENDSDTEQKQQKTTEDDEQSEQAHPKYGSAVHGEDGNDTATAKFKIQFSFKPDVIIPSDLKSAVHQSEVIESKGQKWYQVASSAKPQLLKVENDEAGTVYHRPEVNFA